MKKLCFNGILTLVKLFPYVIDKSHSLNVAQLNKKLLMFLNCFNSTKLIPPKKLPLRITYNWLHSGIKNADQEVTANYIT